MFGMMRWGRKKSVSTSSSSSSSSGLSRALLVSWFSKLSGSSDLKPAKEKKQDDEASQNKSVKSSLSSTKPRNDIHESSKRFHRVSVEKENAAKRRTTEMKTDEMFEEIMSSVKKKVRDFQIETGGFLEVEARDREKGPVIMTPRIKVNREKHICERRDQRLLEQKPKGSGSYSRENSVVLGHTVTEPAPQWQKQKEVKLREVKLKADQQRKSLYIKRELNRLGTKENSKVRVKAIEDLKKAKLRAREKELVIATEHGRRESESFAVVKCSSNPHKDFRDSMIEMIMENGINHPEELKELLVCYLRLNNDEYHDMIIQVFHKVHNDLKFHYFGAE